MSGVEEGAEFERFMMFEKFGVVTWYDGSTSALELIDLELSRLGSARHPSTISLSISFSLLPAAPIRIKDGFSSHEFSLSQQQLLAASGLTDSGPWAEWLFNEAYAASSVLEDFSNQRASTEYY